MATFAEGQAETYCASDILSPDRPPEAGEYAREGCRLMVARELAATLADGNYYTIRLVEREEPYEPHEWHRMGGPPDAVRFTVRADIRRVESHRVVMAAYDPLESMRMPELARMAVGEIKHRVARRLHDAADRVRGLFRRPLP